MGEKEKLKKNAQQFQLIVWLGIACMIVGVIIHFCFPHSIQDQNMGDLAWFWAVSAILFASAGWHLALQVKEELEEKTDPIILTIEASIKELQEAIKGAKE